MFNYLLTVLTDKWYSDWLTFLHLYEIKWNFYNFEQNDISHFVMLLYRLLL